MKRRRSTTDPARKQGRELSAQAAHDAAVAKVVKDVRALQLLRARMPTSAVLRAVLCGQPLIPSVPAATASASPGPAAKPPAANPAAVATLLMLELKELAAAVHAGVAASARLPVTSQCDFTANAVGAAGLLCAPVHSLRCGKLEMWSPIVGASVLIVEAEREDGSDDGGGKESSGVRTVGSGSSGWSLGARLVCLVDGRKYCLLWPRGTLQLAINADSIDRTKRSIGIASSAADAEDRHRRGAPATAAPHPLLSLSASGRGCFVGGPQVRRAPLAAAVRLDESEVDEGDAVDGSDTDSDGSASAPAPVSLSQPVTVIMTCTLAFSCKPQVMVESSAADRVTRWRPFVPPKSGSRDGDRKDGGDVVAAAAHALQSTLCLGVSATAVPALPFKKFIGILQSLLIL